MPTYWSPTAPGVQKVGGKSWWAINVVNIALRLRKLTASLGGNYTNSGLMSGLLQKASTAWSGVMQPAGTISTQSKPLAVAFTGSQAQAGNMGTGLPGLSTVLTGTAAFTTGDIAVSAKAPVASLTGSQSQTGAITMALKATSAALTASEIESGTAVGLLRQASAALAGAQAQSGTLAAALQQAITAITGSMPTPVAFDATGGGNVTTAGTSLSWSHTASGAGRCVLVGLSYRAVSGSVTASVTHGGVAMTSLGKRAWNNAGVNMQTELFALQNPATGAQTVAVTFSTTVAASGNSVSYTGVNTLGTAVLASGSSTAPAVTVASATDHFAVAVLGSGTAQSSFNQTQRYNAASSTARAVIGDSTGTATVSFSTTQTSSVWSAIGVDLIPV